jgi:hypothetical protein
VPRLFVSVVLLLALASAAVAESSAIFGVATSSGSFNPALGQSVVVSYTTNPAGNVSLQVIDRDGYVVRHLVKSSPQTAGRHEVKWDGRDDRDRVVPDEAWSFRIELKTDRGSTTYFPAVNVSSDVGASQITFDRGSGIIRYVIAAPSRVHVQAGCARVVDPAKPSEGPVLRTVVDRQPRSAGSVIEQWNGLDQSGTIYVPDLPNFVIGVAAAPLPENSVITTGNRELAFAGTLTARSGKSLIPPRGGHAHHAGLTAAEDRAPSLTLTPEGAVSIAERVWRTSAPTLRFNAALAGPSAESLLATRGSIQVFVDGVRVREMTGAQNPENFSIDVAHLVAGRHILAVNWISPFGPVAVNAVALHVVAPAEQRSR